MYFVILKESIESANTTIEDEDVKGRETQVSFGASLLTVLKYSVWF